MKKIVVLITSSFPYGEGEQFLEGEVPYLAQTFDQVVIAPHRTSGRARPLPKNVVVDFGFSEKLSNESLVGKVLKIIGGWIARGLPCRTSYSEWKALLLAIYYSDRAESYFQGVADRVVSDKSGVIFYSYWFYPAVIGLAEVKRKTKGGIVRVVTRAHGSDLYEKVHRIKEFPYRRKTLAVLDHVFSVSENGARHLINKYDAKRVSVARLGSFNSIEPKAHQDSEVVRLCSCSFIYEIKRVDRIFDVVHKLAALNPQTSFEWVHIGSGPLKESVEEKIKRDRLGNLKCSLKGHMSNGEVIAYYAENKIDCFINLSTSEGVPVSMMEVMAFGVPVLATNVGGVGEIVRDGAGVLVDVNEEVVSLASEIKGIIACPDMRRLAARKVWEQYYNAEKNYANFAIGLLGLLKE